MWDIIVFLFWVGLILAAATIVFNLVVMAITFIVAVPALGIGAIVDKIKNRE